jgi:protein tyrosine phosphatase (PTP) superfamily phosphohydrolase (DUF442 family)
MGDFELPADLSFNRGLIADPQAFAADFGAKSWLYLNGPDFDTVEGGMSFAQVQSAVDEAENIISDPPVEMTIDLVREHHAAIDRLPRPTLVTCRTGPRSSASVYIYAGLQAGATADEVLDRADIDGAPFTGFEPLREIVRQGLEQLRAK